MKRSNPFLLNEPSLPKFKGLIPTTKNLYGNNLILLVSIINSEQCQGIYLQKSIQRAIEQKFAISMLIGDELHKYNLATDDSPPEQKIEEAKILGLNFLNNNLVFILDALQIPHPPEDREKPKSITECVDFINNEALKKGIDFKVYSWGDWFQRNKNFIESNDALLQDLMQHPAMVRSLNQFEDTYSQRMFKTMNQLSTTVTHYRKLYFYEEFLYILAGALNEKFNYIAYPGESLHPFKTAIEVIKIQPKFNKFTNIITQSMLSYLNIKFSMHTNSRDHSRQSSQRSSLSFTYGNMDTMSEQYEMMTPRNYSRPATPSHTRTPTPTEADQNPLVDDSLLFLK